MWLLFLFVSSAPANQVVYEDIDLKSLMQRSQLAIHVRVVTPAWSTENVQVHAAKPQCGTYPMATYHFQVVEVLKGRGADSPIGKLEAVGAHAISMLAESKNYCDTGTRKSPIHSRYMYGLSGLETGDEAIVFLNRDAKWGYELSAANAFEPVRSVKKVRKFALKGH